MADPEDRMQPEGDLPDGRPRRQPPIIEGEAVEISPDGSRASTAGVSRSGAGDWRPRIRTLLSPWKVAAAGAACIVAIIAGASWIYLSSDRSGAPPPENAASPAPAAPGGAPERPAAAEKAAETPPASADRASANKELESRLAAMDAALAALNGRVTELDRMVREATAAARAAAERAQKAAGLLDEARKNGDEREAAQQLDRSALDDLASRIKTIESRQMTLRQIQERLDHLAGAAGAPDKAVRVAVTAAALRNAVERDRPFVEELAAARTLGLDGGALATLEPFAATGLPRQNTLLRELSALLPELQRLSMPPGQDLSYLDRLQTSAARMLNIRPVKDEPGDDPPAVLRRIELKMVQPDIDGIIAELDKLPAPAKELAKPWREKALARRDAVDASRVLAIAALAKLGEPATSGSSPQ